MIRIILLSFMLLSLTSCGDKVCSKELKLERGLINIPCEWKFQKTSPTSDFELYSFTNTSNVDVFIIYAGNQASSETPEGTLVKSVEKENADFRFKERVWSSDQIHFSGIVDINFTSYGWPSTIQFSYFNIEKSDKEIVDSIVGSFSLK